LNSSDNELIAQIRAGQSRQYAQLVDRHKDKAFTLAVRLVGDRRDAEELVQDAFVRVYRSLDAFRGDAKFSTWFYRIVYNLCMTRISRRRGQPKHVDIDHDELMDSLVEDDEQMIDEKMGNDELAAMLKVELETMPDQFKSVMTLFYVQEMSYEEICETTQLPLGTVKTNLFRARSMLRKRMLLRLKGEFA
jgi:RNA polymerase sigma-70 factor (ECF subfamily)